MTRSLNDLNPKWILDGDGMQVGISFDCPTCLDAHRHRFVWDERWNRSGREFHTLTITPSIDATPFCTFHGWIKQGVVRW